MRINSVLSRSNLLQAPKSRYLRDGTERMKSLTRDIDFHTDPIRPRLYSAMCVLGFAQIHTQNRAYSASVTKSASDGSDNTSAR